jgi:hypothetical protein
MYSSEFTFDPAIPNLGFYKFCFISQSKLWNSCIKHRSRRFRYGYINEGNTNYIMFKNVGPCKGPCHTSKERTDVEDNVNCRLSMKWEGILVHKFCN